MRKGATCAVRRDFERLTEMVVSLGKGTIFTARDLQAKAPGLSRHVIGSFLSRRHSMGWLERVEKGHYRRNGSPTKARLPPGVAAEAVWAVLFTNNRGPLRMGDVCGEAESFLGRPNVSLTKVVATLLHCWYRSGHLERTGKRGGYTYILKPGVTKRPACQHPS